MPLTPDWTNLSGCGFSCAVFNGDGLYGHVCGLYFHSSGFHSSGAVKPPASLSWRRQQAASRIVEVQAATTAIQSILTECSTADPYTETDANFL